MSYPAKNNKSTSDLLLRVFSHLGLRRKIQIGFIFIVMLISGVTELFSLGAVLPFLTIISNPDDLLRLEFFSYLSFWELSFSDEKIVIIAVSLIFGLSVLIAMVVRLLNLWLINQMVAAIGSDLSIDSFRRTLYQPYESHIQLNSSIVITSMTAHISRSVTAFSNVLQMATAFVVAIFIFGGLLYVNWQVTFSSLIAIGIIYITLGLTARKKLQSNSQSISHLTKKQVKSIQESLGSIRDVILDGSQDVFLNPYSIFDRTKRLKQATNNFLGSFPRFVIESFGILLMISVGAYLALSTENNAAIVPTLGVIALGAQRLLPSLQQIYSGWCNLKTFTADLDGLCKLLDQELPLKIGRFNPIELKSSLTLANVNFSYGATTPKVLDDVNVRFARGERIGIIGSTGSGKSTFVDLLMGLLQPSTGELCVDGINIYAQPQSEILLRWRSSIAHVPQSIYLADSSIAENIAFGSTKDEIDFSKVILSAKKARIHDYIEDMPESYESLVGERGVRLSGGQRQRIGIARALYKNANILILDEATSALDDATEKSVIESINELGDELTIFMIAHRQSTLRKCDRIFKLISKKLVEVNPDTLL